MQLVHQFFTDLKAMTSQDIQDKTDLIKIKRMK